MVDEPAPEPPSLQLLPPVCPSAEEDYLAQVEVEELRQQVQEWLSYLTDKEREVLVLRLWEELTPQQIAERLGLQVSAIRKRIERALERLRARLREEGTESQAFGEGMNP